MTPRVITNSDLKSAARSAYDTKRLTAQHAGGFCTYQQRIGNLTCVCAIGASLSPEERATFKRRSISFLNQHASCVTDIVQFDDLPFATKLQRAHDHWCVIPHNHPRRTELETHFLELLA